MPAIKIADLNNAKTDVDHIADIANSPALTAVDRLGSTKRTLAGVDAEANSRLGVIDAQALTQRTTIQASADVVLAGIGYAPPVPYAAGLLITTATQTVEYDGETYAPRFESLPFTTSGVFEGSKFRLIQGVSGADLAAPGGGALVGFIQAGIGALRRFVQDKLRERITPKDFGAIGDGTSHLLSERFTTLAAAKEIYPHAIALTDEIDWAALQAGVNSLTYGQVFKDGGGSFVINRPLDMLSLVTGAHINLRSKITANSLPIALLISADQSDIYIQRLEGNNYAASKAVQVISSFKSWVCIDNIKSFVDAWEVNGTYQYKGLRNGTLYCYFLSRNISITGLALELTNDTKTGGVSPGYVTESDYEMRWMDAGSGIKVSKKGAVPWNYAYDSNRFIRPGFENITGDAFDIDNSTRSALIHPRYENVGGLHVKEGSNCSRNLYDFHYAPGWDKMSMGGILATINGNQIGTFSVGDTVAYQTIGTDSPGQLIHLAPHFTSTLLPNTLYWKDRSGAIFKDRIECKDSAGVLKFLRIYPTIGTTTSSNITVAAYTAPVSSEIIQMSAAVQAQVLTMPVEMERNGNSLLLNVAFANATPNTISIKKSTGTITATVTAAGLYMLAYIADGWRISLVGTTFSA